MSDAQYYALLARALPGATMHEMRWEVSLAEAEALFIASGVMNNECFVWPDPSLSRAGRMLTRAVALQQHLRDGKLHIVSGL